MPQPYDWNRAPIEQRRQLLRMAYLWDGNTYAAQPWDSLPAHIQNDIQRTLASVGLAQKTIDHQIDETVSPIAVLLRCSCGWHTAVSRKQNALARAAKVRSHIHKHLEEMEHQPFVSMRDAPFLS
jgi:hypothetical protein